MDLNNKKNKQRKGEKKSKKNQIFKIFIPEKKITGPHEMNQRTFNSKFNVWYNID